MLTIQKAPHQEFFTFEPHDIYILDMLYTGTKWQSSLLSSVGLTHNRANSPRKNSSLFCTAEDRVVNDAHCSRSTHGICNPYLIFSTGKGQDNAVSAFNGK